MLPPGDGLALVGAGVPAGDGLVVGDGLDVGDGLSPGDGLRCDALRRASLAAFIFAAACICRWLSQLQLLTAQPGWPPAPTRQPSHRFPGQPA